MTEGFDNVIESPCSPHFGICVEGFGRVENCFSDSAARIRGLVDRHLVVVVRNQSLSAAQLKEFTSHFGKLFIHHADEGVIFADGIAEVLEMRKEPDGVRLFGGSDWHADVTFRKPAGYVSILHAKILPAVGGDTVFANTMTAYQGLSEGMKTLLGGLRAVHSYDGPGRPDRCRETAVHPVIRVHPVTGQKGIYINKMFAARFEGMTDAESRPLIAFLDEYMSKAEFTFRHRWQDGDLVLWDNRFTLHYPINDFAGERRLLIRCTAMEE